MFVFYRFARLTYSVLYLQAVIKCPGKGCKCTNMHPKGHKACGQHSPDCADRSARKFTPWKCGDCANLLLLAATDSNVEQYYRKVAACFFVCHWKCISRTWERLTAPDSVKKIPFLFELLYDHVVYYTTEEMKYFLYKMNSDRHNRSSKFKGKNLCILDRTSRF